MNWTFCLTYLTDWMGWCLFKGVGRLQNFNYTCEHFYNLLILSKKRKCIFGEKYKFSFCVFVKCNWVLSKLGHTHGTWENWNVKICNGNSLNCLFIQFFYVHEFLKLPRKLKFQMPIKTDKKSSYISMEWCSYVCQHSCMVALFH